MIRQLVDKFIASTGQEENQWWPIVKRVSMRIPNCGVCNNGAVLVDLPGIQDSNAARDRIAKDVSECKVKICMYDYWYSTRNG